MIGSIVLAMLLGTSTICSPQLTSNEQARAEMIPLRVIPDPEHRPFTPEGKARFFHMWDRDGDGFASAAELGRGFARRDGEISPSIRFLEERDVDRDGRLSLNEVLSHPM